MADLRDIGLSKYEARAYRSLLDDGPTTAKELSDTSGVPMGRIYDVLNSLEQHQLARSQAASRPKKYVAVEPETAEELAAELEANEQVDEQFWTAAVGSEESAGLLLERLSAAEDRIVMIAATPSSGLDLGEIGEAVTDELAEAMDRGVEVDVLLAESLPADFSPAVGRRYAERMADDSQFTVRTHPEVHATFTLIDEDETCLEVPHPVDPGQTFAMIDLKDPDFAADVRERFQRRWADAEEFSFSL
ncbi:MAG: TrmB family transcriptional regulator [Halobaculum sp.]